MRTKTLGTVLLAAWLGLLLSGTAHAADWRSLDSTDTSQVFLDEGSIATVGDQAEAVVLVNYTSARTLGDDWFQHRSQVVRYRVACTTGEAALKAWTFKSGELGSGTTVWKRTQDAPVLATPAPDTVESRLVARLCGSPQASVTR